MLRQNHQQLEGNERYEGFCVDMLRELADILKFKYRIRLVGDGLYGVPGTNGSWTGMVGELISRVRCNPIARSSLVQGDTNSHCCDSRDSLLAQLPPPAFFYSYVLFVDLNRFSH